MYEAKLITEKYSSALRIIFPCLADGHFLLSSQSPPSADLLLDLMFNKDSSNINFAFVEKASGKVTSIAHFHHLREGPPSITVHLLNVKGAKPDPARLSKAFLEAAGFIFKKYGLSVIRSSAAEFEKETISVLESAGFIKEADLREQVFCKGRYHSVFLYSLTHGELKTDA